MGKINWANAAMRSFIGLPESELKTKNALQVLGVESDALASMLETLGSASLRGEMEMPGSDGCIRRYDLLIVGEIAGTPDLVQIILTDLPTHRRSDPEGRQRAAISARRPDVASEQYEVEQEVEGELAFLSGACREVQIAADALNQHIELLVANVPGPAEYLSQIHSRVTRLSTFVGDLATLARADPEVREFRPQDVDLEDLIEDAALTVYTEALRKRLRLIIDISEEAQVISTDPRTLRRLLVWLLAHAVRATPPGGTVAVSARRSDSSYLVGVSDAGLPLEPEDMPHVFRPFAELDPDALRSDEFARPVLALAKRLVDAHGGSIWVERTADGGNTFFFSLLQ